MTGAVRPRTRSKALALRAQERAEIDRRAPRPRQVTTALTHLREARLELLAAMHITDAAEIETIIRRLAREAPIDSAVEGVRSGTSEAEPAAARCSPRGAVRRPINRAGGR